VPARLEHVAEGDEAVGALRAQQVDGPPQFFDLLVDVGQDAQPHGADLRPLAHPRYDAPGAGRTAQPT
jgi:hypothetical protein